jgi:predicted phage terminase large subunit-like protein
MPAKKEPTKKAIAVPTLNQVKAEMAKRDLAAFSKEAWKVVEPHTPMLWNWHLDLICEYLMLAKLRHIRRLIINVPPQTTKSRTATIFFPAWCWVTEPQLRFMCVSYSGGSNGLSTQHSAERRELLESRWYQSWFPGSVQFSRDQNQKTEYKNVKRGRMVATSTNGTATGKSSDFIILDDLINPKQADSDSERKSAIAFVDKTLRSRLSNQIIGVIIIVEQRTHDEDTSGHAKKLEPGVWTEVSLPMEATEHEQWTFPITGRVVERRPGELLWPERFPAFVCKSLRIGVGTHGYESQYQQQPSPPGGTIIKEDWIRYWTKDPRKTNPLVCNPPMRLMPEQLEEVIGSWDMSFKNETESSRVSGQVWGKAGARRILLGRRYGLWDFVQTQREVRGMKQDWPIISAMIVEDKANGPAIIASLKDEVQGLIPWPPKGHAMDSKEARMFAVSPQFEAGNVELPDPDMEGYAWVREYVVNLKRFPNKPNDDGDATSQALERLRQSGQSFTQIQAAAPHMQPPILSGLMEKVF